MKSPPPDFSAAFRQALDGRDSLPFSEYLDLALYHPALGYYAGRNRPIGRSGDFYTNVSIGPVFAEMVLAQILEMWILLGRPAPFYVIEQGGHDGQFAADFLAAARAEPDFHGSLRYALVEPHSSLARLQQSRLESWKSQTEWHSSPDTLRAANGVHWSNELIDALPFELIEWNGARWLERRVAWRNDGLHFVTAEIAPGELQTAVEELPRAFEAGYQTEIRLRHRPWLDSLASALERGFVLLCDYGYSREAYYSPGRRTGTLRSYREHRASEDPLSFPGEQDLTAHVDFTQLIHDAESRGFRFGGLADQHHFLVGAGEEKLRAREGVPQTPKARRWLKSLQTLLHPELMGGRFQFLALSRGPIPEFTLSGFRFPSGGRLIQ